MPTRTRRTVDPKRRGFGGFVRYSRGRSAAPILVAVDDDLATGIVESLLTSAGYPVVRAERAGQILLLATRHQARVVVLDLNTADRAGLEVIRILRRGEGKDLGILALTVQTRAGMKDEALAAGADVFLTRPFYPGDLIKSVARLYGARDSTPQTVGPEPIALAG
jgi:two-component system, OmpR family, phosphate regulon response regulator PhoB